MIYRFFVPILMVTLMNSSGLSQEKLSKNERIVFFGDSITQQGDAPGGYVQIVRDTILEKAADKNVKVFGAGVGGNKVPDLLARLEKDVLSKNPTTVVVYIGINDVWHSQNGKGTDKTVFKSGLEELVKKIRAKGAKVWLCTPSVIGEKTDGTNELQSMLSEYAQITRGVSSAHDVPLIDLHSAFEFELKERNKSNKEKGILTTDGVHLNAIGNQFVARMMLEAFQIEIILPQTEQVIRHIVLFKFVEDLDETKIKEVVDAFAKLPDSIPFISGFEMGTNISPENLDQGFTHCFVVTFNSVEDRDAYLPHPAHKKFVELIGGKIDKVLVFDFEN